MKFKLLILTILCCCSSILFAQSLSALEAELKNDPPKSRQMELYYLISRAHYKRSKTSTQVTTNAAKATRLASELQKVPMLAKALHLEGKGYYYQRKYTQAENKLRLAVDNAKIVKDVEILANSFGKLSEIAKQAKDYRKLDKLNQDLVKYIGLAIKQGGSKQQAKSDPTPTPPPFGFTEEERAQLIKENTLLENKVRELLKDKAKNTGASEEEMKAFEEQLEQAREEASAQSEMAIDSILSEKDKLEKITKQTKQDLDKITSRTKLREMVLNQEVEKATLEKNNAELQAKQNQFFLLLMGALSILVLLLALIFFIRFRSKKKAAKRLEGLNAQLKDEEERSNELLENILPAEIAKELKETGKAKARKYDQVTVLFSDFKNFTTISEQLSPEDLVKELDTCFKAFDFIIGEHEGIEKIKTIGDAYMCASGFTKHKTIPNEIIKAALEMQQFLDEIKEERKAKGLPFFEARIGLHTGPVVAGVVGVNKFAYDIWGDTVNIASRMESQSEVGKVNISESTYDLVRYRFNCQHRGKISAKNKGMIDMYFVNGEV